MTGRKRETALPDFLIDFGGSLEYFEWQKNNSRTKRCLKVKKF